MTIDQSPYTDDEFNERQRLAEARARHGAPAVVASRRRKLIGLTGLAGSGKDAAGLALLEHRGFTRVSLADPIKRVCQDVFGWPDRDLWGPSEFRELPDPAWDGLTPRRALQALGTEWGRAMHPDVWVRLCLRQLPDGDTCITDVRFQNEVNAINTAGGIVVRIVRPGVKASAHAHVSESGQAALTDVHTTVPNDGTLTDLATRICLVADSFQPGAVAR